MLAIAQSPGCWPAVSGSSEGLGRSQPWSLTLPAQHCECTSATLECPLMHVFAGQACLQLGCLGENSTIARTMGGGGSTSS